MSELEELRAAVDQLAGPGPGARGPSRGHHLSAQYGPSVDSGQGEATAALWTEDGSFDAVPSSRCEMGTTLPRWSTRPGRQRLITNGCGLVLTVPHIVVDGDEATGRSYALNIRRNAEADRFWVARVSANTWRWVRTPQGWRIADRVNAASTHGRHREMLARPADADTGPVG